MPDAPRHSRRQTATILGYARKRHLLNIPQLTASLHKIQDERRQAEAEKQNPPGSAKPKGFTNRTPGQVRSNGGRSPQRKQ